VECARLPERLVLAEERLPLAADGRAEVLELQLVGRDALDLGLLVVQAYDRVAREPGVERRQRALRPDGRQRPRLAAEAAVERAERLAEAQHARDPLVDAAAPDARLGVHPLRLAPRDEA